LKRMMIGLISEMTGEPRGIDALQIDGIVDVLFGRKAGHTVRRRVAVRSDGGCLVFSAAGADPHYDIEVTGPGKYRIGPLNQVVKIAFSENIDSPMRLKSPGSGERCAGRKIVKLLADRDIMKSLRPFWPVVVRDDGEIVSVAGIFDSEERPGVKTEFPCHA